MREEKIEWLVQGQADMPALDFGRVEAWIEKVASLRGYLIGGLVYIFCDDETIIDVNRRFLSHDYYTDIITFDYRRGRLLRGDMYISLDTVATNAEQLCADPGRELLRVIVHGVLHLMGLNDKGPGEREIMEAAEDEALALYETIQ